MTSNEPNWTTYALTADPGKPLREAKATIATLTGDNEMLNGIIKGLRQMLADVEPTQKAAEQELHQHSELLKLMVDGAARLRLERDEARHGEAVATATLQGWIEERTTLRAERDEARKLLCDEIWMSRGGRMSVDAIAKERGWDCFEKDGNA